MLRDLKYSTLTLCGVDFPPPGPVTSAHADNHLVSAFGGGVPKTFWECVVAFEFHAVPFHEATALTKAVCPMYWAWWLLGKQDPIEGYNQARGMLVRRAETPARIPLAEERVPVLSREGLLSKRTAQGLLRKGVEGMAERKKDRPAMRDKILEHDPLLHQLVLLREGDRRRLIQHEKEDNRNSNTRPR